MAGGTRVVRFAQGLEQSSECDVVFQYHVFALSSLRPIGIFALPLDRGAGNGIGYGVRSAWVLLEVICSGNVIEEERGLTFALFFRKAIASRRKSGPS